MNEVVEAKSASTNASLHASQNGSWQSKAAWEQSICAASRCFPS
jgi:hypothetical protein